MSGRQFRENSIGNRFWESGSFNGDDTTVTPPLSRSTFPFGKATRAVADGFSPGIIDAKGQQMQRDKPKWRADHGARALKTVSEIEASVAALPAEDLLDLHDIFAGLAESPLGALTFNEMRRRNLSA